MEILFSGESCNWFSGSAWWVNGIGRQETILIPLFPRAKSPSPPPLLIPCTLGTGNSLLMHFGVSKIYCHQAKPRQGALKTYILHLRVSRYCLPSVLFIKAASFVLFLTGIVHVLDSKPLPSWSTGQAGVRGWGWAKQHHDRGHGGYALCGRALSR